MLKRNMLIKWSDLDGKVKFKSEFNNRQEVVFKLKQNVFNLNYNNFFIKNNNNSFTLYFEPAKGQTITIHKDAFVKCLNWNLREITIILVCGRESVIEISKLSLEYKKIRFNHIYEKNISIKLT